MDLIELSQDDYGVAIQVTLSKSDDETSAENLTTASYVSLDITRMDGLSVITQNAIVTVVTAASGIVSFTPDSNWFTPFNMRGHRYFTAIFKIVYAGGIKRSFKSPVYVHVR